MFEELGISCSYTLEASFSGLNGYHFNTEDLKNMGRDFCLSLGNFADYLEIETATQTAPRMDGSDLQEGFPVDDVDGIAQTEAAMVMETETETKTETEIDTLQTSMPLKIDTTKKTTTTTQNDIYIDDPSTPLNLIMEQEMNYWRRQDGENVDGAIFDGEESAGSDSDPSGDNLAEGELKKRLARKVAKKKRAGKQSRLSRLASSSRSKQITASNNGSSSSNSISKKKTDGVPLMPPRRPDGKKPTSNGGKNRRSFTEVEGNVFRSQTPRGNKSSTSGGSGEDIIWSKHSSSRAQSANSVSRRTERRKFQPAHAPMYRIDSDTVNNGPNDSSGGDRGGGRGGTRAGAGGGDGPLQIGVGVGGDSRERGGGARKAKRKVA